MLIYANNSNSPFSTPVSYKSVNEQNKGSIQSKDVKRVTQKRRSSHKVKKNKKKRSLNAKNVKFLKNLGYKVKKQ